MTYRASPRDGVAWVTGASSGIGRAVALELARRGWTVAATARRLDALEALARDPAAAPGRIVAHPGDVTDEAGLAGIIDGIERIHGPVALAFLNAGTGSGAGGRGLPDGDALRRAFAVNLFGVANGLLPLLARMGARGRGQIAVNASVAGYRGLPGAAAYGASKAAAIHLCEALAFDARRAGVTLQVVNPGFVETPMTARNRFPMPFLTTPDAAARRICDGFARDGFEIAFPRRLALVLKVLRLLPYRAYHPLVARVTRRG